MKYALFLGCTVPVRAQNYEMATRKVAERFGIELVDLNDFGCCGFPVKSVNREAAILLAARNLSLAEEQGLSICTLCSACTGTLTEVNHELKENEELRSRINEKLSSAIGREYKGGVEVRHLSRILYEDIGIEKIKGRVTQGLSDFSFAPHYGCHYTKPSEIYGHFDDPEHPETLDKLIEVTGARSLGYEDKMQCCGGGILGIDEATALKIAKAKLDHIKSTEADGLILICPFCDIMYEQNQKKIGKQHEIDYSLPIIYYPQLLGLALGIPQDELGFKINRVKPKELLEKFGGDGGSEKGE